MEITNILGLDTAGLERFVASLGEKPFRARQLMRGVHQRFAGDFLALTDADWQFREKGLGRKGYLELDEHEGEEQFRTRKHKGACIFLSDLCRAIPVNTRIEFIGTSSYGRGKTTSGEVKLSKDLDVSIEDQDVILVEDIVDSGVTLTYLMQVLWQRKPRSMRIATLLDKPQRRLRPVKVDYVGFQIPDEFVVGYGMDYSENHRNLKDICVLSA